MIFHRDLGFPSYFRAPHGVYVLIPSRHAKSRASEKGFILPEKIDLSLFSVIEIEMVGRECVKMLLRGTYSTTHDICIPVVPRGRALFAKTAWLNHKADTHKTLDPSRYNRP